jgi:hypothetical protein
MGKHLDRLKRLQTGDKMTKMKKGPNRKGLGPDVRTKVTRK